MDVEEAVAVDVDVDVRCFYFECWAALLLIVEQGSDQVGAATIAILATGGGRGRGGRGRGNAGR